MYFLYWAKGNVIFIPRWAMTICYQFCMKFQTFKSQIDNKNQVAMLLSIIYIRVVFLEPNSAILVTKDVTRMSLSSLSNEYNHLKAFDLRYKVSYSMVFSVH